MTRILLLLLLLPGAALAQDRVSVSVSNFLRYGNGRETIGGLTSSREYFENLTETRLGISDFTLGFRLLFDTPPEFGVEFTGLQKRYLEFRRDDLSVRAGTSTTLFGKGLSLNLFENRALAFDTGLDGARLEYATRMYRILLTGGDITYRDILNLDRTEFYRIRAASVELMPYASVRLGAAIVSGESRFPPPTFPESPARFDIPEFFGRLDLWDISLSASYAEKRTRVEGAAEMHRGTAWYAGLEYAQENLGVSFEYKDYRFGIADPYERTNANRATKAFAFQSGPSLHKEHTFTLLSRFPHGEDFDDEVGMQVDAFYTLGGRLTGSLNGSMSSRHYSFAPTGDTNAIFLPVFGADRRSSSFLPDMDPRYSPYWEVYADVQYYLEEGGNDYVLLALDKSSLEAADELTSAATGLLRVDATRTTGLAMAAQYSVGDGWAVKLDAEQQWVHEDKNAGAPEFQNHLVSAGLSLAPSYSLTLRVEWSNDRGTVDGRNTWAALEGAVRIGEKHTLTLAGGADRGGQVCANGRCRIVNPFSGFRATILSYL
jgi:hypothetical protein